MAAMVYKRLQIASIGGGGAGSGGGLTVSTNSPASMAGSSPMLGHSQLTRSLERILEEAHFSGELILTNRKLKDFPKMGSKFSLTDTVIADLSRNRFCELPEEITTFAFLETLLLYHNAIRSIPESVKQLSSLTYLDLRSNQLSSLPREICFLPLQVLLVSNNRLATLPDELGRLDQTLTDLDASYNQLSALPVRLGELRTLRSLSLRSNQLLYLPREITCLSLVSLDVSNNRIASLPLEIRHMSTLVELQLENNPLTAPPASLCMRGLVHVFKFLETQATREEKGARAGGNYDGYTTLRRAPRHNSSGNMLETTSSSSQRHAARHQIDSGYSTSDGLDKRWSHDAPGKSKTDSPLHCATLPRALTSSGSSSSNTQQQQQQQQQLPLSADLMDASLTSSTSTIVDESLTLSAGISPLASPCKRASSEHLSYAHSNSSSNNSNSSSPDQDEDLMLDHQERSVHGSNGKLNKSLNNIQTYKEYKEALKQQRNQEINSVYKQKHANANDEEQLPRLTNGSTVTTLPKSIMKQPSSNGHNGNSNSNSNGNGQSIGNGIDDVVIPKKPIQKVIPSRNTELMKSSASSPTSSPEANNAANCLGYVKPHSPMKNGLGAVLTNNNSNGSNGKFNSSNGSSAASSSVIKSPVSATSKMGTVKTHRTVTWNHDIPAEKLSFTMRREFDRQREETELMSQLRSIIETRLKMTLPEDIASALTDGVILCHLANYVRPRSVASIHVPSPGVNKLSMARCRRNVDNFLEACRRIGVDEELICSCADVVPQQSSNGSSEQQRADDDYDADVYVNGSDSNSSNSNSNNNNVDNTLANGQVPNAVALLRTVAALIALDANPHHQHMRYLQQQEELQLKLQQLQQQQQPQPNLHVAQHFEPEQIHKVNAQNSSCTKQPEQMQQQVENVLYENCEFINGKEAHMSDDATTVAATTIKSWLYEPQQYHQQQRQQLGTVGQLLRTAKQKTFEKIKQNLISPHGQHSFQLNNNTHRTLQTIIEHEHDVAAAGPAGHYQLIDEKQQQQQQQQQQQLQQQQHQQQLETSLNVVKPLAKRIEFFEQKPKLEVFSICRLDEQSQHHQQQQPKLEKLKQHEAGTLLLKHDSHTLTIILSCVFIATFLWLNLICCAADVLEGKGAVQVSITVGELFRLHGSGLVASSNNGSGSGSGNSSGAATPTKSPTRTTRATLSPTPLV
ncbi:leucine-rich repeat and calponin homology domain-containing protein isoform X3 [Drosophila albomicans]|uniref:Leucine-rich repeat and calponin homology domain-containing protein isoform X3 n=1 Tax=Drosophila albomicans TaxID=7291 RepID=A0A6P8WGE7_DROAB|nr:leucine-rich repeat and calponin homology domain-containing protein isoform X3 [Drosophila albomicans]